jgi:hypothetical protein
LIAEPVPIQDLILALRFYGEGHFDHGKLAREVLRTVDAAALAAQPVPEENDG